MELDDLKHQWQESAKNIKPLNANIIELIQNKENGPAARLKKGLENGLSLYQF